MKKQILLMACVAIVCFGSVHGAGDNSALLPVSGGSRRAPAYQPPVRQAPVHADDRFAPDNCFSYEFLRDKADAGCDAYCGSRVKRRAIICGRLTESVASSLAGISTVALGLVVGFVGLGGNREFGFLVGTGAMYTGVKGACVSLIGMKKIPSFGDGYEQR